MQLKHLAITALLALAATPAHAACTLILLTNGTLSLSSDNTTLTSEGGIPATFTVASTDVLGDTVTVAAPSWVDSPPLFNRGTAQNQISYFGVGLLSFVNQGYTSSQSSFGVGLLGATLITMNNKITSATGFRQGNYQTKTTITCS